MADGRRNSSPEDAEGTPRSTFDGPLLASMTRFHEIVSSIPSQVVSYISANMSSGSVSPIPDEGLPQLLPNASPRLVPYGFSFSPAGLLFPYHFGVARYLETKRFITDETPLMGASAGALVVVCIAVHLTDHQVFKIIYSLQHDFITKGTRGRMRKSLRSALEKYLPNDAHIILNNRPQPCIVIYSALTAFGAKGELVKEFQSRSDLIDCLLASCNIPMYFSNKPWVSVRGQWGVDGYFSDVRTLGCPAFEGHARVGKQVRVMPFDASKILGSHLEDEYIAPDLCYYDHLLDAESVKEFKRYMQEHTTLSPHDVEEPVVGKRRGSGCLPARHKPHHERQHSNPGPDNAHADDGEQNIRRQVRSLEEGDTLPNLVATEVVEASGANSEETAPNKVPPEAVPSRPPSKEDIITSHANMFNDIATRVSAANTRVPPLRDNAPINPWGRSCQKLNRLEGNRLPCDGLPYCRYGWPRLLHLALNPAEESEMVKELFDLGRSDAFRWSQLTRGRTNA